jgi:uncharacterized phage protein (TIGR02220 family)
MSDRLIRDDLLTSERYWKCSPEARNLYVSILLIVDDEARCDGEPFVLRTRCMAGTVSEERISSLLNELVDADLVRPYDATGKRLLFVPRFRLAKRYTKRSRLPAPPQEMTPDILENFGNFRKISSTRARDATRAGVGVGVGELPYVGLAPDVIPKNGKEHTSNTVFRETAIQLIAFLNEKTGHHYRPVEASIKLIVARLKEGASEKDIRQVIANRARAWNNDPDMVEYLRPETLFNATKFASYIGIIGKANPGANS